MRITVGIKSLKEADYFLRNGADEIYFGAAVPNHRGSCSKEKEIVDSIKLAKRLRKKTLLALNQIYPREKYGFLLNQARRLTGDGLDGIVVRDLALLEYFADKGFRTYFVAGINCACFNSQAMEFYRDLGVRRFTLNSQTMPEDARKMVNAVPKIETGMFVPCLFLEPNIVPFCFFGYPGASGSPTQLACVLKFKCGRHDFRMLDSNLYFQANLLYDFHKLGVDWLKVSRQRNTLKLIAEFKITRFLNQLLEKGVDRKTFAVEVAELVKRVDMNQYGHSYTFKPFPAD
jgi:hypothetical protein